MQPTAEATARQRSQTQETDVARKLSGRKQPGSGAFDFKKGDVITETHLIECKVTKHQSFPVSVEILKKISDEAFSRGLKPAVSVRLENAPDPLEKDWVVIPLNEFKAFLEILRGD